MDNLERIKGIEREIKLLQRRINELEQQKKQLELISKSQKRKNLTCTKCGSDNLCIKFKGNENVKLIGLYCLSCAKKSKKRTGYIKFLSEKEYLSIKEINPNIKELHEESQMN